MGHFLACGEIPTPCSIPVFRNDTKRKYMILRFLKTIQQVKGLYRANAQYTLDISQSFFSKELTIDTL